MAYTTTILCILLVTIIATVNGYTLSQTWDHTNFFNNFNYYSGPDPTHGYVYYTTQEQASSWGYTSIQNNQIHINSDSSSISSGSGRGSVRLQSNQVFQRGLFVFDVVHMPVGCGTWPAIWTANLDTWPNGGEIDFLEGVNNNKQNTMTLHTGPGCKFSFGDCGAGGGSTGCSIVDSNSNSYGDTFNNNGGGAFVLQWESSGIFIWFFPRNAIPADITNNNPNTASWGTPRGSFYFAGSEGCSSSYFYNHHIIIDNTFCGDWAGAVFSQDGCGSSCQSFVQNNPGAFANSYWVINSFKIYQ